jgi:GLPGLI family protein
MNLKAGTKFMPIFLFFFNNLSAQFVHSGKITFERRTNLQKRFNSTRIKNYINQDNKLKNDSFYLYFNDTVSVFKPIESDIPDEMSWATSKNSYKQNLTSGYQLSIFEFFGQNIFVSDTLPARSWKLTSSIRTICGYECRKAIYQKNDSTRIYAWYTSALIPNVGPEGFCGLPGTILGVATEDGGVIYFAKKIEAIVPTIKDLSVDVGKNKPITLKLKIENEYGNTPWGKRMFDDFFRWL